MTAVHIAYLGPIVDSVVPTALLGMAHAWSTDFSLSHASALPLPCIVDFT